MAEDDDRRAVNRALMRRFATAIGDRDWAALADLLSADFLMEMPYGDPVQRLEGREAYLAYVEPALSVMRFRLSLDRIHDGLDPDQLISEYTSDGVATPTGKPYRNVYIGVFRFRDGRICGLREYWNPMISAAALAPD